MSSKENKTRRQARFNLICDYTRNLNFEKPQILVTKYPEIASNSGPKPWHSKVILRSFKIEKNLI